MLPFSSGSSTKFRARSQIRRWGRRVRTSRPAFSRRSPARPPCSSCGPPAPSGSHFPPRVRQGFGAAQGGDAPPAHDVEAAAGRQPPEGRSRRAAGGWSQARAPGSASKAGSVLVKSSTRPAGTRPGPRRTPKPAEVESGAKAERAEEGGTPPSLAEGSPQEASPQGPGDGKDAPGNMGVWGGVAAAGDAGFAITARQPSARPAEKSTGK